MSICSDRNLCDHPDMTDKPLPTPPQILEQRHLLYQQKAERLLIELIRGAFLINGGALVALTPVVTAMIGSASPARLDLQPAVFAFIGGLVLAATSTMLAYIQADEETDVSEYRMRRALLPRGRKGPMGWPLKAAVLAMLMASLGTASYGFIAAAEELEKLANPAPCPASEPFCNLPAADSRRLLEALLQVARTNQVATEPAKRGAETEAIAQPEESSSESEG